MIKLPDELAYITNSLKPQKTTDARLDGKLCVISGTTSGVGYQAARQLAKAGAQLVMICRNREKALKVQAELWLFTNHDGYLFAKDNYIISNYKRIEHFHVTAMTLPFLNPSTRKEVLEERYILQLKGLLREKK